MSQEKNRQMSIKVGQNDLTRKMIDFGTFIKTALECGRFGQINCCQRLKKVAQCPINRQIWSHCRGYSFPAFSFSLPSSKHKLGTHFI